MPAIVPSYVAKLTRAKKHIDDLETEVKRYAAGDPYRVADFRKGKKKAWRLEFTADPANTDIPIIAADVIYNLRSALDHLMSCVVANKDRTSAIFPIYFQGVGEAIVPGENQERTKFRLRWASDVKTLPHDAITILKRLQPPDDAPGGDETNLLRLINRLSNRDRHEKLPVIAAGLKGFMTQFRESDGTLRQAIGQPNVGHVLENHAELLDMPHDAMDVQVKGIPEIAIKVGEQNKIRRYVTIPNTLTDAAEHIESTVFPLLVPFVRR